MRTYNTSTVLVRTGTQYSYCTYVLSTPGSTEYGTQAQTSNVQTVLVLITDEFKNTVKLLCLPLNFYR